MGTRGAYGFHMDGKDYLTYNHSDSYPDWLGKHLGEQLRTFAAGGGTVEKLRGFLANMRMVTDDTPVTDEDRVRLADLTNGQVGDGEDWYSVIRELQGDILGHLKWGVMIDSNDFIMDSLFCEYAYIVNLDDGTLEFYRGFQDELHDKGRYGGEVPDPEPYDNGYVPDKYYGCALIATFPLDAIPVDVAEQMESLCNLETTEEVFA